MMHHLRSSMFMLLLLPLTLLEVEANLSNQENHHSSAQCHQNFRGPNGWHAALEIILSTDPNKACLKKIHEDLEKAHETVGADLTQNPRPHHVHGMKGSLVEGFAKLNFLQAQYIWFLVQQGSHSYEESNKEEIKKELAGSPYKAVEDAFIDDALSSLPHGIFKEEYKYLKRIPTKDSPGRKVALERADNQLLTKKGVPGKSVAYVINTNHTLQNGQKFALAQIIYAPSLYAQFRLVAFPISSDDDLKHGDYVTFTHVLPIGAMAKKAFPYALFEATKIIVDHKDTLKKFLHKRKNARKN